MLIEQDDFEFIENHRHIGPQNESWPALVEILDRSQEILEVTRQAATLPALGYAQAAGDARTNRLLAVDIALASANQSLLDTDLSGLNALRALERLLRVDAERAAIAGRGTDAAQNIRTLVAMSEHVLQPGAFLIDQIVGVAIFGIAAETTGRLLAEYQNFFTEDELVQLLELFVNYRDGRIDVSFDTERIVFEDQLQRIYTDHGAGRGSITAGGLFAITELNKTGWKAGSWIIASFFAHLAAHREEERALFNESIDAQVAVRKGEPRTWDPDAIQAVENNLQQRSSKEPYCVLACLLGSPVGVAIDSQQRVIMLRDATLTAIALVVFASSATDGRTICKNSYPHTWKHYCRTVTMACLCDMPSVMECRCYTPSAEI